MQDSQINQSIQDKILSICKKFPNNTAITYHKKHMSYKELNERILQIEKLISNMQIKGKNPIGVCMDVSPVSISVILSILKAEMIALPLCTVDPEERILEKLYSTNSPIVFCEAKYEYLFSKYSGEIIIISEDWNIIKKSSTKNIFENRQKSYHSDVSYMLFTSGSTGKPKGVMNSISNITKHLEIFNKLCEMTSKDVLMGFSPFYFDASLEEIFAPLSIGARYVVLDEIERMDENLVKNCLVFEKVTILSAPSPILGIVNNGLHENKFSSRFLRLILTGGEILKSTDIDLLVDNYEIKNGYGLTETTVSSLWHTVSNMDIANEIIPIGKPIEGKKVYILNNNLKPVNKGESGEIYLGGQGVACGYFNDISLTKEKFIKNPFETENNEIMFKTGDIGHFNANGDVVFEGRCDRQVNVGGMNFLLDEVENELSLLPEIHDCVVIGSNKQELETLDAYIVLEDPIVSIVKLMSNIKKRLPSYMIPKKFYCVDDIPKTITGKINYIELKKKKYKNLLINNMENNKKLTETESLLRNIWSECFKQKPQDLPLDISLFDMGGNSLIAMRIVSKIRDLCDKNFSIQDLLNNPSIKKQAEKINSSINKE